MQLTAPRQATLQQAAMADSDKLDALQSRLGCRFASLEGLRLALTHSSAGGKEGGGGNYERLEFLGDRVLGLVVAALLYQMFPDEQEGHLAKRHAALVQGATLARIARDAGLGDAMTFSGAERAAGGAQNDHILADGIEAVIGALYLDGGLAPCHDLIARLWQPYLLSESAPPQDPKTTLQEWAQGRGLPLPLYEVAGRTGPDHVPLFEIRVTVQGYDPVHAQGASRRAAEKEAARMLLERLP